MTTNYITTFFVDIFAIGTFVTKFVKPF